VTPAGHAERERERERARKKEKMMALTLSAAAKVLPLRAQQQVHGRLAQPLGKDTFAIACYCGRRKLYLAQFG
jgi:hypothetical protein